jgi:hypothetical protein
MIPRVMDVNMDSMDGLIQFIGELSKDVQKLQ